jgi:nitrogen-specific signal transduction histidine kinase
MSERYSGPGAARNESAISPSAVRELIERLVPGVDGALLLSALQAEQSQASTGSPPLESECGADARELARVRRVYSAGEAARAVHHAMSNTLTALQTEAQLLELEPLADDHRRASTRIVELTRRLATVMRRLDPADGPQRTA